MFPQIIFHSLLQQKDQYLLDFYPGEIAAYSLRILKSSFATSSPVRIRRSSDNQEADLNFDTTGYVSLNSTLTNKSGGSAATNFGQFIAASGYSNPDGLGTAASAFVTIWRDQSGSGYNQTQTTAANQPRLALNGVLDTTNGHVSMYFSYTSVTDASTFIPATIPTRSAADLTLFAIGRSTTPTAGLSLFGFSDSASNTRTGSFVSNNLSQGFTYTNSTTTGNTTTSVNNTEYSYYAVLRAALNTTAISITNTTATSVSATVAVSATVTPFTSVNRLQISRRHSNGAASNWWFGYIGEAIAYSTDQTTNRVAIQQNQIDNW